jgi:hypothetical protein
MNASAITEQARMLPIMVCHTGLHLLLLDMNQD